MRRVLTQLSVWLLAILMLSSVTVGAVGAPGFKQGIAPHYVIIQTIRGDLSINHAGKSTCSAYVRVENSSYKVVLTCDLYQNGNIIKSWSTSGKSIVSMDKTWYVTPGYDYQVEVSATVYDANGNYVDSGTAYSPIVPY